MISNMEVVNIKDYWRHKYK